MARKFFNNLMPIRNLGEASPGAVVPTSSAGLDAGADGEVLLKKAPAAPVAIGGAAGRERLAVVNPTPDAILVGFSPALLLAGKGWTLNPGAGFVWEGLAPSAQVYGVTLGAADQVEGAGVYFMEW